MAAESARAGFSPRRFVHADPAGRRGRRLATPRGRGLEPHGLELHGNLHTLGYFAAEICAGTPAQTFDVIIDTGSSLTAVACKGCSHCGSHTHPGIAGSRRFDEAASSTASAFSCHHPPSNVHCSCSDGDKCGYAVSYTEGSSIRGHIVSDLVWFAQDGGGRAGVSGERSAHSCHTSVGSGDDVYTHPLAASLVQSSCSRPDPSSTAGDAESAGPVIVRSRSIRSGAWSSSAS